MALEWAPAWVWRDEQGSSGYSFGLHWFGLPVVLPDGTLFGEGVKSRIKERLLQECNLHTIVRLPNGVFAPYTGIKTNLLFFTKGQPTQHVWYYEHPYPPGVKNYNKTKPIRIEEFDAEKAWWGIEQDGFASRAENERAWKVSIDTIRDDHGKKVVPISIRSTSGAISVDYLRRSTSGDLSDRGDADGQDPDDQDPDDQDIDNQNPGEQDPGSTGGGS